MPWEREPHLHSNGFITGRIAYRAEFTPGAAISVKAKKQSRFAGERGEFGSSRSRYNQRGRIDPSIYRMENSYTTTTVGRTCQGIKDRVCRRMEEAGITDNRVTKMISFDNRIFRAVALLTIDQSFEFTSRPSNDSLRSSDIKKRAIHFELSTPRSGKKKKKEKKSRVTNTSNNLVGRQSGIRR